MLTTIAASFLFLFKPTTPDPHTKDLITMTDLSTLNTYRVLDGKSPLKSWKESKSKLNDLVAAYANTYGALPAVTECAITDPVLNRIHAHAAHIDAITDHRLANPTSIIITPTPDDAPIAAPTSIPDVTPPRSSPAKQKARPAAVSTTSIALADIARELNIDPKIARAKMRRVEVPADYTIGKHVYKLEYKSWVVNVLTVDFRKGAQSI